MGEYIPEYRMPIMSIFSRLVLKVKLLLFKRFCHNGYYYDKDMQKVADFKGYMELQKTLNGL